jgi:Uncharacterised nucleotidyltransferase
MRAPRAASESVATGTAMGETKIARRAGVMDQLRLDAAAVEAVRALREAAIRPLLFKGPSTARWLYDEAWERPYGDIDLLVAPADHARGGEVIAGLGYVDYTDFDHAGRVHASQWMRADKGIAIDLHHRLTGTRGDPQVFRTLCDSTETIQLGSEQVETLGPDARAVVLALHAAQHGATSTKPLVDLRRGLERLDDHAWRRAAELADRLGATEAFAAGLRILAPGAELAERLGLGTGASVEVHLRAAGATVALGLMGILEPRTWRSRVVMLRRELVPSRGFMRVWQPLARRGQIGMAAAYAWRPLWLLWKLPAAIRDLQHARRLAGGERRPSLRPPG